MGIRVMCPSCDWLSRPAAEKHLLRTTQGDTEGVPDSGSKNRERSFPKGLKREARNCQQRRVKGAQRPRGFVCWLVA